MTCTLPDFRLCGRTESVLEAAERVRGDGGVVVIARRISDHTPGPVRRFEAVPAHYAQETAVAEYAVEDALGTGLAGTVQVRMGTYVRYYVSESGTAICDTMARLPEPLDCLENSEGYFRGTRQIVLYMREDSEGLFFAELWSGVKDDGTTSFDGNNPAPVEALRL